MRGKKTGRKDTVLAGRLWVAFVALSMLAACSALPLTAPALEAPAQATASVPPTGTAVPGFPSPTLETPSPVPEVTMTLTPSTGSPTPSGAQPLPSALPAAIASALQGDLAQRLGLGPEQVTIVSAERTEMPTGTLGCGDESGPQNQALILGTEIAVEAQGEAYLYRTDGRVLMPCSPNIPGPVRPIYLSLAVPKGTTGAAQREAPAVADLAARLGVSAGDVTVISVEAVEFRDSSLGCAQPGMMYAQVITPGYRIILEAGGKRYDYRMGSSGGMVLCGQ